MSFLNGRPRRRIERVVAYALAGCVSVAMAPCASRGALAQRSLADSAPPAPTSSRGAAVRGDSPSIERLGDLYDLVARSNPRIAASRALARAAGHRVGGARRPPDPEVQLGFMNYALPSLVPMAPLGMTQLQVMQMMPLGGKLSLGGRVAEAQSAAAAARADDVAWEQRTRVAMAFYDLYANDRALDVAREALRLLREVATTTESMYRVGDGRQADVLRARVEIARMIEDTLRMQAMRETMAARLNALLDRDGATAVGVAVLPRFPDALPSRRWLDSVAYDGRAMVQAGREDVRGADANERLARRALVPDVQVGVQYGQRSARGLGADGMPTGGTTERMGSLMIGASIPVFARSRQLQMREEAVAMREMARADLEAMRAETRGRIGEAYAAIERSRRLSRLYATEIIPQSEAAVASAHGAYRAGGVDFMTLLENRMGVNRYRQELAVLAADEGKGWAELEMLIGRPLLDAHATATSDGARPTDHTPRAERAPLRTGAQP